MDSGIYAAYTGLMARTQALDTAANNLANAGTNGFRAQRDYFRGLLASGLPQGAQGSQIGGAVNSFGVLGGSLADFAQGPMVSTANPLDVALNGPGFFAIKTAAGTRYTRDGAFTRSPEGMLQTQSGEPVLDSENQPILLPNGPVTIAANGTVSVAGGVVAQLGVFSFPAAALTAEGTNRFAASGTPTAVDPEIKQGAVEGANQDAIHGTMQLILVQRQAEMMQKALTVFHTDFDKTATEELGRV